MAKTYTITKKKIYSGTPDKDGDPSYTFQGDEDMQVSDGYHTMDELYEHRIQLWISTCKAIDLLRYYRSKIDVSDEPETLPVWKSKLHDDGSEYEGWFILGIGKKKGEIMTYHLPNIKWDEVSFAETLERAPEYDGHTSNDVLIRLKNL